MRGVLRRSGPPYRLTTRELTARTLVSAGVISQRLARAESAGLTQRTSSDDHRRAVAVPWVLAAHRHARVGLAGSQWLRSERGNYVVALGLGDTLSRALR